ncbi:hypothetical protein Epro_1235 [Endomicrobium proavitum]|uniref:Uncharacterized protein n=1 Tax=Endomicrobium proavitum TaxID=1408281 RepID=A0A0G3WMA7_9BACT|nr:hypothetical protein Epro_1235 [Endomicrobium proavitum]
MKLNKNLKEIVKMNPKINIDKIKEVNNYMDSIRPLIKKESYNIGIPDVCQDQQSGLFCFNLHKEIQE